MFQKDCAEDQTYAQGYGEQATPLEMTKGVKAGPFVVNIRRWLRLTTGE
jgi:hypothetical protein